MVSENSLGRAHSLGRAQSPFQDVPAETLVETILRSHKILSRVHEEELQEARDRSVEMIAALRALEEYRTGIEKAIAEVRTVTAEQAKLVNAWNGRHQDFLENFDKKSAAIMEQVAGKHLALLDKKSAEVNQKATEQFKAIISQLAASLQLEIDALDKKVKDMSNNAIHDLNDFSSAVRKATNSLQEQSLKLYGRVLVLSVFGAFTGTVVALIAMHFWKK
ncbi:hypothetical protein HF670_05045 [Acidithiobacillus thiooxidans]|uniref:Uncharacterized protein n=1 Tax=Acidithiobacillus thiooxidans TaxID=930 RepID=A0A1C2I4E2_ACITH|nr:MULTISPECIES: hypothetical protein [Acidithiobacillus]MBU2742339.1 hypothetical protein [Acidithiobacillus albertensis]MBU2792644.1 hypothetical protein [Acidithiobacillus thiooxidans]MBU2838936.1 hypothetical protein [Acidithiobacillus thiooxidans]MBU2843268.1 hypothetical protein [Acidithiobacillus thiooxidans]OCX70872.1 hypothetical protein A6M23_13015 [Acidithiobacillus thiooxidans]